MKKSKNRGTPWISVWAQAIIILTIFSLFSLYGALKYTQISRQLRIQQDTILDSRGLNPSVPIPERTPKKVPLKQDPNGFFKPTVRVEHERVVQMHVLLAELSDMIQVESSVGLSDAKKNNQNRKYRVILCADSTLYMQWQTIIFHHQYKQIKKKFSNSDIGGFTRLLNGYSHDWLSEKMETVLIHKIPGDWSMGYFPSYRGYQLMVWSMTDHFKNIPEDYIMLAETDYLMQEPMPNFAQPDTGIVYGYWYLNYTQYYDVYNSFARIDIPPGLELDSSIAPSIMHKSLLTKIVPLHIMYGDKIRRDDLGLNTFGYVTEMAGFALATTQTMPDRYKFIYSRRFIAEYPVSLDPEKLLPYFLHYTYAQAYDKKTHLQCPNQGSNCVVLFNKKDYYAEYPQPSSLWKEIYGYRHLQGEELVLKQLTSAMQNSSLFQEGLNRGFGYDLNYTVKNVGDTRVVGRVQGKAKPLLINKDIVGQDVYHHFKRIILQLYNGKTVNLGSVMAPKKKGEQKT